MFIRECKNKMTQTCSKSCSSKLVRINNGKNNIVKCEICGDIFNGQSPNSKYCNKNIKINCFGCENTFDGKCNKENGNYCTTSCRNKYMRKESYKINLIKKCPDCGTTFTPSASGQKFCNKNHYRECEYCQEKYIVKTNTNKIINSRYCSNSCSTFAQMNSKFDKKLIYDYKNINEWAINFKNKNSRKPKLADFIIYFNLNRIPSYADKKLFSRASDSRLELIILYYLRKINLKTKIIRRYREKINGRWLEIDIFFPEYNFGFEVQDFSTHCKEESEEISKFGNPMKDARYHKMKKDLFKSIDITVYELWEDEIFNGDFEKIVDKIMMHYLISLQ